jgi:ATP-dependent DNA helicase RecG
MPSPGDTLSSGAPAPARGRAAQPRAFGAAEPLDRETLLRAPVHWPRPSRLEQPLEVSGKRMAAGLRSLQLDTVGALLEHLPAASREARTIAGLAPGDQATVAVEVRTIEKRPVRRRGMRPLVQAQVFDATGAMRATFFNQPWLAERYAPGTRLLLHGKAGAGGRFNVAHHAVAEGIGGSGGAGGGAGEGEPGGAVAHYPAAGGITSTQLLTLVRGARPALADVAEPLPAAVRVGDALPDRAAALAALHFPRDGEDPEQGRRRLAYEELLLTQLALLRRREGRRARTGAPRLDQERTLTRRWLEQGLPFAPTGDQLAAIEAIAADLSCPQPMQRLLMGEVGSGKTVVALFAMLRAVEHGLQAALMAPTETLAEQHFATLQLLLGAEPVSAALLTGSTSARRRADTLGKLASGELSLLVGTHALIEPDVRFRALGVAVIDEQHRFGVRQRAALGGQDAGGPPHTLHMTATPIPRTLALSRFGDLDATALRELPRGRSPVATRLVAGERARTRAYEHLRAELRAGRQAFVVCPLIDEEEGGDEASGVAPPRAASAELRRLEAGELAGFRLALLHGAMPSREKQAAMAAFASGEADVLVATTVIEVGIDVPNATVMVIENAERFGISQLHQLRGRVGRGEHRASCFLCGPTTASGGGARSPRLRALAEHGDGFQLAEIDLQLRRHGELAGTRQSGAEQFAVARLPEDAALLERARTRALEIVAADPDLRGCEHALLARALEQRFGREVLEPIAA